MRISEALELYEKSRDSYKARLKELKIKELYDLVKDLKLFKNPEPFKTSHNALLKKLHHFLKELEDCEKTAKKRGFDILRKHVYEETGFRVGSETLPSVAVRKIINEVTGWSS